MGSESRKLERLTHVPQSRAELRRREIEDQRPAWEASHVFDQEQRHRLATHMHCLSPANLGRTDDQTDLALTWEVVRNRHVLLGQLAELVDTEIAVESNEQAESSTLPATAPQQHCQADEVADVPRERRR